MNYPIFFFLSFGLLFGESTITISGNINIDQISDSSFVRICPDYVDSCLHVCSDGTINACHPSQLFPIDIEPAETDSGEANLSHYRIYFPWEYNNGTADKFIVTASLPCLSPTAVYASGNYVYWDIYGNDNCPGTLQGVIWYGDDCQDEDGNIGSNDCDQLVGRFCFVAGDTLEWPVESDQSISTDICDACWMSQPAWGDYANQEYSDPMLFPDHCEMYDHCHHSTPDYIDCGLGYLDDADTTSMQVINILQTPKIFSITNYPNPFNPITNIRFYVTQYTHLDIIVYDVMGNYINEIFSGYQNSGYKTVQWDGTNRAGKSVSPGLYFCRMKADGFVTTNKMILLK